jgi:hypothetical protein
MFESLHNIIASKKDQSIQGGFFLRLSGDKILDLIFFVVDFEVHIFLDALMCK